MPLFVRAGATIPMGPVKQYTDERVDGPLTVTIYPGADGAFVMYEDDGKSFAHREGAWTGIEFVWDDTPRRLTIRLAAATPEAQAPRTIAFEGRELVMTF